MMLIISYLFVLLFFSGNLRLVLTSPSGTPSTLLMERPRDVVSSNFDDWPFLSVHFWGENPRGRWTLHVVNAGNRHVMQPGQYFIESLFWIRFFNFFLWLPCHEGFFFNKKKLFNTSLQKLPFLNFQFN